MTASASMVASHTRCGRPCPDWHSGDDEVVIARLDGGHEGIGHADGGHRRGVVVGGDLLARDQRAVSPGHGLSTTPLKKYVTWAYFSVSATWNCRQPASLIACASDQAVSGGNATSTGRPSSYSVIVTTRRSVGAVRPLGDVRSNPANAGPSARAWVSWRARSARVGHHDGIARRQQRGAVDDGQADELIGLSARIGGFDGLVRGSAHGGPLPHARSRRSQPRSAPSGDHGPSRSTVRPPWRWRREGGRRIAGPPGR